MKSLLKCILKKHYDRQLEADQNEFIETHYRECYTVLNHTSAAYKSLLV